MAVTLLSGNIIQMTAAGDEITLNCRVQRIRWDSTSAQTGDQLEISDPANTSDILFESLAAGPYHFMDTGDLSPGRQGMKFGTGLRIQTMTGDRGTVRVYLA